MSSSNEDREQRIRERAYSLWEEEGRPDGRGEEFWERARGLIDTEDDPNAPNMISPPPL
ncbi:MAG: DUF2934 domain-containing protein [Alphaproteobacteria bacterium]|nr:DUF2934 domain-containing protein [Rhodospirillales bacterium]MBN9561741.1 DUF2934 domain-containing protein [Alphaproteobacteria bacterium]